MKNINICRHLFFCTVILSVIILFFFSPTVFADDYDHCSGGVKFVGNKVIDTTILCYLGPDTTSVTARIKKDGQTIYQTSDRMASGRVEGFFRDTHVAKGRTYEYSFCGVFAHTSGEEEICSRADFDDTATAGEVGGELTQDLEMSGETISIHRSFYVHPGVTLSIDNSIIEREEYTSIKGPFYLTEQSSGGIRITNSTIQKHVSIVFTFGNANLLSGNDIYGYVGISDYAAVEIRDNNFVDHNIHISSANAAARISRNIFQNSFVDIGDYGGDPTVLIDNNEFIVPLSETGIIVEGGDVHITNNTFLGQIDPENNQYAAAGITVDRKNSSEVPIKVIVSDSLFSGFNAALRLYASSDVTASGNVFRDNRIGCDISSNMVAVLTDNSFYDNVEAIDFWGGGLTFNHNCIAGNTSWGFDHFYYEPVMVDAIDNWWGAASGPYSYRENPDGTGDRLNMRIPGTVSFTPWLTTANCEVTPSISEPEPSTLNVTVDDSNLPADGSSTTTLTITLKDENSQPIANASIELGTPTAGTLGSMSGTTDASGRLQVEYQAPTAGELDGQGFVELNIQYPGESISASTVINFTFATLSVWADPHIDPYSSEVAIIPGDSRFPGRYQFTLRDYNGQPYPDQILTIHIPDSTRAQLEGGGQTGRQIEVTTDSQGHATVDYIYLGYPDFGAPFVDTITVSHPSLITPVTAQVSVGLDIEITTVSTPERDSGTFPKMMGMRLQLEDFFHPGMDLIAYLSALESLTGNRIALDISTRWLNPPAPEFMDRFQAILPNYGNDDAPELYQGTAVINYADNDLTQAVAIALDSPQVTYGANALPAIIFTDPGNYWFSVYANPVILPAGASSSSDFVRGACQSGLGDIFGASILPEAESIFQSVVCSVKPTNKAQFLAMTLFVDNPYFTLVPPIAAANMMVKASGILCDYMQGNYVTAALNMASLGADSLENSYTSGLLDITYEQFLTLSKIVRLNRTYQRLDNMNGAKDLVLADLTSSRAVQPFISTVSSSPQIEFMEENWPDNLDLAEYLDVLDKTNSGEMGAYSDMAGGQILGVISDGNVSMNTALEETEYYSANSIHIFMLPPVANTLNIETSGDTDIYRYYRASDREVYTARYNFTSAEGPSFLSLPLQGVPLLIDDGADGTLDTSLSPEINSVDTTSTILTVTSNQKDYRPGDTVILSATLTNSGESLPVDIYFVGTDMSDNIFSFPSLNLGQTPIISDYVLPARSHIPETTIFTFLVSEELAGAGKIKIDAFLTYPGTMNIVGEHIDSMIINFP